ncbi:MAG: hypothetical protein LH632_11255, partial [Rhodoferax sp.]|nr:hypothetical protein [Rhodoferax sp.]
GADTGKLFISFRGVAQRSSSPSDLSAVAQIGAYGEAIHQIVDKHNWWLPVSTPIGATSPNLVRQYEFSPLLNLLTRAADVPSTGELVAFFPAGSPIRVAVTGSSLGGHLAMAFATLFPANTVEAVAFNSPGFPATASVQSLFAGLGGVVPVVGNPLITNVLSREANNAGGQLDLIAGYPSGNFPGQSLIVPIEDQYLTDVAVPKRFSWNHDQRQLTDGLAVFEMLQRLDTSLTLARFDTLLRSAASGEDRSFENLIDTLESTLGINTTALISGNTQRDELHAAVQAIVGGAPGRNANAAFQQLAGAVRLQPVTAGLDVVARRDFGALLALKELTPFYLTPESVTSSPPA